MNIISLICAIVATVIFVFAYEGHRHGHLGLGLAFLTTAWIIQLIFPSLHQIAA